MGMMAYLQVSRNIGMVMNFSTILSDAYIAKTVVYKKGNMLLCEVVDYNDTKRFFHTINECACEVSEAIFNGEVSTLCSNSEQHYKSIW